MVGKKIRSVKVGIGAKLDASFGSTLGVADAKINSLKKNQSKLTNETKKTENAIKRETKAVKANLVSISKLNAQKKTATGNTKELDRQIQKLTTDNDKYTASISKQRRDLSGYERDLNSATRAAKRFSAAQKIGAGVSGAARTGLRTGAGMGVAGAVGGIAVSSQVGEQSLRARSMGLDPNQTQNQVAALKQYGIGFDNYLDIQEELNNKVGEFNKTGEQSELSNGLAMLGLSMADLQGLSQQDQLQKILETARTHEDSQAASSAVDMITGAEGNKIVAAYRDMGMSIEDVSKKYEELNHLTDEGREGNKQLSAAWSIFSYSATTAIQEIVGMFGSQFAPVLVSAAEGIGTLVDLMKESPDMTLFAAAAAGVATLVLGVNKALSAFRLLRGAMSVVGDLGGGKSSPSKKVSTGIAKRMGKRIPVAGLALSVADAGLSLADEDATNAEKGGGLGGLAGGATGAAAGAAIGSVVPIIGTVVGGIIGGLLGEFGGSALGEYFGGKYDAQPEEKQKSVTTNNQVTLNITGNTVVDDEDLAEKTVDRLKEYFAAQERGAFADA